MPGKQRLAPTPVDGDVLAQLCIVAEELVANQREMPLLRETVERLVPAVDTSGARTAELISEIRELIKAVDRNTEAILSGKGALDEHRAELERGRGAKP